MPRKLIMQLTPEGDFILLSKLKGTNPDREKHPSIKCPNCGKFMFYIYDKEAKNKTLCVDLDNARYRSMPRDRIRVCQKCHHRIGMLTLTPSIRRILELPQMHECHEKIVVG